MAHIIIAIKEIIGYVDAFVDLGYEQICYDDWIFNDSLRRKLSRANEIIIVSQEGYEHDILAFWYR